MRRRGFNDDLPDALVERPCELLVASYMIVDDS